MNTPNNAAALERLEQKWREEASAEWAHCQNKELSEWVRDRCYGQHNRLLSCADELATLRATLAQPDALTSQPSGEVEDWTLLDRVEFALRDAGFDYDLAFKCAWLAEYGIDPRTHPSADAPGVAVDEVLRGVCMRMLTFENSAYVPNVMFQQLRAALAPKPEGGL